MVGWEKIEYVMVRLVVRAGRRDILVTWGKLMGEEKM